MNIKPIEGISFGKTKTIDSCGVMRSSHSPLQNGSTPPGKSLIIFVRAKKINKDRSRVQSGSHGRQNQTYTRCGPCIRRCSTTTESVSDCSSVDLDRTGKPYTSSLPQKGARSGCIARDRRCWEPGACHWAWGHSPRKADLIVGGKLSTEAEMDKLFG